MNDATPNDGLLSGRRMFHPIPSHPIPSHSFVHLFISFHFVGAGRRVSREARPCDPVVLVLVLVVVLIDTGCFPRDQTNASQIKPNQLSK